MKITTRMTISSLIMLLIILSMGITGYLGLISLYKDVEVVEGNSRELDAVSNLHFSVREVVLRLDGYLKTGNPAERKGLEDVVIKAKKAFDSVYLYKNPDPLIESSRGIYESIIRSSEDIIRMEDTLNRKEVLMLMAGILEDADRIAKIYAQVHLKDRENLESAINDAKSTRTRVDAVHKEGAIIALMIGVILMFYNTRSITGPIKGLRDGAMIVSSGNWSYKLDAKGGEELVELSNSIDRMRNTILGQVDELDRLFRGTITALASAVDAKSPWTRGHSERVTSYSLAVGAGLGLPETDLKTLELAALLHDIGKIGTYEAILDKAGKLTEEELKIIRQHPSKGAEILSPIKQLESIVPLVKGHHESYDGSGYPDGLKGEEIPLMARILAVCDSYDAMTADRPYRKGRNKEDAVAELKRCAGTQFDPEVVTTFLKVF